jgi:hypothetical protein
MAQGAETKGKKRGVHLIVLIHGLYGNPDNLAVVKEELERAASGSSASAPSSSSSTGASTVDRKGKGKAKGTEEEEYDLVDVEDILDLDEPTLENDNNHQARDGDGDGDESGNGLEVRILVCKSFTGSHTWDGIDINAHRASKEIDEVVSKLGEEDRVVEVVSFVCPLLGSSWSS